MSEIERDVGSLLEDIQLTDKSHVQSKALSGGMKRKLSVLLALIGGSKVRLVRYSTSRTDSCSLDTEVPFIQLETSSICRVMV